MRRRPNASTVPGPGTKGAWHASAARAFGPMSICARARSTSASFGAGADWTAGTSSWWPRAAEPERGASAWPLAGVLAAQSSATAPSVCCESASAGTRQLAAAGRTWSWWPSRASWGAGLQKWNGSTESGSGAYLSAHGRVAGMLILAVEAYRVTLAPLVGGYCRYQPSCSQYAQEALARHGAPRGLRLAVARLLRCHPFRPGGYDPVP